MISLKFGESIKLNMFKANWSVLFLNQAKDTLDEKSLYILYNSLFLLDLTYCVEVRGKRDSFTRLHSDIKYCS